jgi:hypothetical protein
VSAGFDAHRKDAINYRCVAMMAVCAPTHRVDGRLCSHAPCCVVVSASRVAGRHVLLGTQCVLQLQKPPKFQLSASCDSTLCWLG